MLLQIAEPLSAELRTKASSGAKGPFDREAWLLILDIELLPFARDVV